MHQRPERPRFLMTLSQLKTRTEETVLLKIANATDCYRYTEYVHIHIGVEY
jgi:hypothetical protein